jgi:hypothetical protein
MKKTELKAGKKYVAFSPNGYRTKGTYDWIPGCALATSFSVSEGGQIDPDFAGETEVFWDGQEIEKSEKGEALYICEYGDTWADRELDFREQAEDVS